MDQLISSAATISPSNISSSRSLLNQFGLKEIGFCDANLGHRLFVLLQEFESYYPWSVSPSNVGCTPLEIYDSGDTSRETGIQMDFSHYCLYGKDRAQIRIFTYYMLNLILPALEQALDEDGKFVLTHVEVEIDNDSDDFLTDHWKCLSLDDHILTDPSCLHADLPEYAQVEVVGAVRPCHCTSKYYSINFVIQYKELFYLCNRQRGEFGHTFVNIEASGICELNLQKPISNFFFNFFYHNVVSTSINDLRPLTALEQSGVVSQNLAVRTVHDDVVNYHFTLPLRVKIEDNLTKVFMASYTTVMRFGICTKVMFSPQFTDGNVSQVYARVGGAIYCYNSNYNCKSITSVKFNTASDQRSVVGRSEVPLLLDNQVLRVHLLQRKLLKQGELSIDDMQFLLGWRARSYEPKDVTWKLAERSLKTAIINNLIDKFLF